MLKLTKIIDFLFICGSPLQVICQDGWTKKDSDNGKYKLVYKFSNSVTSENKIQLVEYVVSSTEKLNYEKCKAVIKNLNTHRAFLDYTEKSKVLKTYNSTEWLIYYFFDAPWPLPNSDCVSNYKMIKNKD